MTRRAHPERRRAPPVRRAIPRAVEAREPEWFYRFSVSQRLEHLVLMVSFAALVLTGLPQKYSGAGWAEWLVPRLGGVDNVRFLHRIFAFVFIGEALYHLGVVISGSLRGELRPSMVPSRKDVRDAMAMLRYCLGAAREQPQFDRFEYRQKFEYWAFLFGAATMIVTGLALWFPTVSTGPLPGQIVPASREAHGDSATFLVLAIVGWHLYSVLLSPAHFPGDLSIFTGRISARRMLQEHPLEYARILAEEKGEEPLPLVPEREPEAVPRRWRPRRVGRPHVGGDGGPSKGWR